MIERLKRILRFFDRRKFENELLSIFDNLKSTEKAFSGKILIDGTFDNPNYWYRLQLTLNSLGIDSKQLIGFTGPKNKKLCKKTLEKFGCEAFFEFSIENNVDHIYKKKAVNILSEVSSDEEFLNYKFPYEFPAELVYDHILKKQKKPVIDFKNEKITDDLGFVLRALDISFEKMKDYEPDLVIVAHCIGWYAALTWAAICNGKESIILFGDNGLSRFWRIKRPDEIFTFVDCPYQDDFSKIISDKKLNEKFSQNGEELIQKRFSYAGSNLGAFYAYKKRNEEIDRVTLCEKYNWNTETPIIAVYSSNWFDYPHTYGMKNFENFLDWIKVTVKTSNERKDINWIFKGHPVDEWYGGITLEDIISLSSDGNLIFAEKSWNGHSMIKTVDGIITCHGTIGIEATAEGVPVLNADVGFYDNLGFTIKSSSREDYIKNLNSNWWENVNINENQKKAKIFAGCYWGRVSWQKGLILNDDSEQWELYEDTIKKVKACQNTELKKEMEAFLSWIKSGRTHFNTFKILRENNLL